MPDWVARVLEGRATSIESIEVMATNAEPDKGAGYIKMNVKDKEGLGGVLYLKLEFCKEYEGDCKIELPKISDWPAMQR